MVDQRYFEVLAHCLQSLGFHDIDFAWIAFARWMIVGQQQARCSQSECAGDQRPGSGNDLSPAPLCNQRISQISLLMIAEYDEQPLVRLAADACPQMPVQHRVGRIDPARYQVLSICTVNQLAGGGNRPTRLVVTACHVT